MNTLERARRVLIGRRAKTVDDPATLPAAVALILVDAAAGPEALLIRRAERVGDPWSGQVALPGGRCDPEDADLVATAIRETREETGVDLERAERLGALDDIHPRTPALPPVFVRPFVFALATRPVLVLSNEVRSAFWVGVRRLSEPGVRRDMLLSVRGAERTFPAFVLGEDIIWGMTERILSSFLDLVATSK